MQSVDLPMDARELAQRLYGRVHAPQKVIPGSGLLPFVPLVTFVQMPFRLAQNDNLDVSG